MKWILGRIAGIGNRFMRLSDRRRAQLVVLALVVLGGGGVYKLVAGINRLSEPHPVATPEQLIGPMEKLFQTTKEDVNAYQRSRRQEMNQLDSLARQYTNTKINP